MSLTLPCPARRSFIPRASRSWLAVFLLAVLASGTGAYGTPEAAAGEAPELYQPRGVEWTGPWLKHTMVSRPHHELKVWVFLTDKGVSDPGEYRRALEVVEESWNIDTRERRAAAKSPAVFSDLPVHEVYVRQMEALGFDVVRKSRWLNAMSVRLPAGRIPELAELEFVRFVQPVMISPQEKYDLAPVTPDVVDLASAPDTSLEAAFYGNGFTQLEQLGIPELHRMGYSGAGVKVMVIDTGFKSSHPVFGTCTNLAGEYDFVNDDGNTENEGGDHSQQHRHGTGVWAVMGGYAPGELIGGGWAATFYLAKTEDITQEVRSEEDNYVAALEWADTLGVDIASASLSYLCFDDSFCYTFADLDGDTAVITQAVDIAVGKGMACLNAAGNNGGAGASSIWTPQDADSVISVGAVDAAGAVAGFSSYGPTFDGRIKPEILAMGVSTYWAEAGNDGYGNVNGTSLATPVAAGLAILLKEAHPGWSGFDIREALMQTADNAGAPSNGPGWGIPHGPAALTYLGAVPSPPKMTLPFALCDPPDSAVVSTTHPKLTWSASEAAIVGDTAQYTVFARFPDDSVVSFPANTDTCLVFPGGASAGDTISWWVHAVGDSGYVRKSLNQHTFLVSSTVSTPETGSLSAVFLGAARPNPARTAVRFSYRLPEGEPGKVQIFNAAGRLVRSYAVLGTGRETSLRWDRLSEAGGSAAPGAYFYRLIGAGAAESRKVILLP